MKEITQEDVFGLIDDIHEVIDQIDDGYHNKQIAGLIKISNRLFDGLTDDNQHEYVRRLRDRELANEMLIDIMSKVTQS